MKKKLDKFHYHELLDRTSLMIEIIDTTIMSPDKTTD